MKEVYVLNRCLRVYDLKSIHLTYGGAVVEAQRLLRLVEPDGVVKITTHPQPTYTRIFLRNDLRHMYQIKPYKVEE